MPFGRNRGVYSPRWSYGCLAVFALPFVAIGGGMSGCGGWMVAQQRAMRTWVETPATITKAELEIDDDSDGTSYTAVADYEYDFGGRHYRGKRVTIGSGSNTGGFHRRAYRDLKKCVDLKQPFRCFVNPADPSQAVLYRDLSWESLAFSTIFATTFGTVGFAILVSALIVGRKEQQNLAPDPPPDQPWLARSDWASGRIAASGGKEIGLVVLPVVVVYWFIASTPLMTQYPTIFAAPNRDWWKWLTLLFPAIGMLIVYWYLRIRARRQKFGDSVFEMASVPGVVGGQLAGVIRIPRFLSGQESFRLKLQCVEKRQNKNSDSEDKVIWHDERMVDQPMRNRPAEETAIPVLFAIPYEAAATTAPAADRVIEWRLEATAATAGVDYREQFEVPVFKTPDSRPDFQLDETIAADFSSPVDPDAILREDGIFRELLPNGGVRLRFPARRNRKHAFGLSLFTVLWFAFVSFISKLPAVPFLLPIIFECLFVILAVAVINLWLVSSVTEASQDGIWVQGGWLGFGRKKFCAAENVSALMPVQCMSSGTTIWTQIQLVTTAGKKRMITKALRGKLVERTVLSELNNALGREAANAG